MREFGAFRLAARPALGLICPDTCKNCPTCYRRATRDAFSNTKVQRDLCNAYLPCMQFTDYLAFKRLRILHPVDTESIQSRWTSSRPDDSCIAGTPCHLARRRARHRISSSRQVPRQACIGRSSGRRVRSSIEVVKPSWRTSRECQVSLPQTRCAYPVDRMCGPSGRDVRSRCTNTEEI